MAIEKGLIAAPVVLPSFLECVFISRMCNNTDIIAGVLYRPPDLCDCFADEFCRLLTDVCMRFPNYVIIFGDFNFPSINWDTLSVSASDKVAHAFLQACLDFHLTQLITEPTRSTGSIANILDLILTNNPEAFSKIFHRNGVSDHDIITGCVKNCVPQRKTTSRLIRCYKRANFDQMNRELPFQKSS